jgi:ATP-dependent exoDNAse (exonuclease V) alpha subunit
MFHHKHNVLMCRELLYTAITRAREELVIICEPTHFQKAVETQRIKGNTLAEKAEFFKGKQATMDAMMESSN